MSARVLRSILQRSSVRIRNELVVGRKIDKFVTDGSPALQHPNVIVALFSMMNASKCPKFAGWNNGSTVVSDFDHTLSRAFDPAGKQCHMLHGLFDTYTSGSNVSISKQLQGLTKKYSVIEFDPNLTNEQKTPHMLLWWQQVHELILQCGFNRAQLVQMMIAADENNHVMLRDGAEGFLQECCVADIPVVLFSAGIGTLIDILLRHLFNGVMPPNLHIISNMMEFDENDNLIGFKDPLIHTFNKNSSVIGDTNEKLFRAVRGRQNVLLMGDSIGDLQMGCFGENDEQTVLSLGFLNQQVDAWLAGYMNGYDIVLVQDQTMEVPLDLLKFICDYSTQ